MDRFTTNSFTNIPEPSPGPRGTRSPISMCWSSGTIRSELWRPRLSKRSIEYQPARPKPIWTIHGQMSSGRALTVTTRVALKIGRRTIPSPGMLRANSSRVAPHLRCHGRYMAKNATAKTPTAATMPIGAISYLLYDAYMTALVVTHRPGAADWIAVASLGFRLSWRQG